MFNDVHCRVLGNGLTLLVREDSSAPVAALNFFVGVGSLNEDEPIAGWSHGIEHMLFKGTERRGPGDIAREIQDVGGETNAGTGYESTNYYIVLPAHNVVAGLDIHADVLRHSVFDEFELEKERQVLIQENRMYRDRPTGYGFTWEGLLAEAFTTHRYRRPIGGPDENLLRVGREAIVAHKERYYVPGNITYVVVGDVKADEVFAALEERLGDWEGEFAEPDRSPVEPPQSTFRFRETTGDVEQAYVKIGFHVSTELDPETDALMVLAHILGTGRSSRLYREVRERGLILGSSVLETTGRDPGYLVVEFTAEPAKAQAALVAVMDQIRRFIGEPVSAQELARTRRAVVRDTLSTLESVEGQASILGHYALLGDYRLADGYVDRISAVTPAAIRDAAGARFQLNQATLFIHSPQARPVFGEMSASSVQAWLQERLAPVVQAAPTELALPGILIPRSNGTERDPVEILTLERGTRVVFQRDRRLPLAAVAAYLPVGSGSDPADRAGVTRLAQISMMKGADGHEAAEIDVALDDLGARMRPFWSRDVCGFSLGAMSDDLFPALDLFTSVLTRPTFPEDAVALERERTLAALAALRDDTVQFTVAEFFRLLFPDHAYGRPVEGTETTVPGLGAPDLAAWHARAYRPDRLFLSVVGDVEKDAVIPRLEALTRELPASGDPIPAIPDTPAPAQGISRELEKDVSQAVIVLGVRGPTLDAPERHALEVWNQVLSGMGNRLFTRLRDERHLCYFTGSFVSGLRGAGAIGGYVGTGPDQVDAALEGLRDEFLRSVNEAPTPQELNRARNAITGNHLIDMQSRMAWAATYARDEALGLGYRDTERSLAAINAVTAQDVVDVARRYLEGARLTTAVLRPATAGSAAGVPAA